MQISMARVNALDKLQPNLFSNQPLNKLKNFNTMRRSPFSVLIFLAITLLYAVVELVVLRTPKWRPLKRKDQRK